MRRVTVNGTSYWLPYEKLFRSLTETEYDSLRTSIGCFWVHMPVVIYQSDTHGWSLIDGANRAEIANVIDAARAVPVKDLGNIPDSIAEEIAKTLNSDRRHLSGEDYQKLSVDRAARMKRITTLKFEGRSLRDIAAVVEVSTEQVRRDWEQVRRDWQQLRCNGEVTPEDDDEYPPARVNGRDGKSYPARRTETLEPAPHVSGYQPSDLPERAGNDELEKLTRLVSSLRSSLCTFIGLDAPQWPAVASAFKRLGITVKPGRGPKPATCPALEQLVEELAEVSKEVEV